MRRGHDLDLDVEEVHHPLVFSRVTSNAAMTAVCRLRRSTLRSASPLASVRVRIVVQEDEDPVCVAEKPLLEP